MENKKARVIAYYLPQFHPIPENDEWWGKGFTEWTNVIKAKALFKGHKQPRVPTELGYYNLLDPNIRESQATLAKEAGIEGFCYWHYWFGNGRQLLETPFNEVLETGKPDFPFCLAWANHTWSGKTWDASKEKNLPLILMEQKYLGIDDYTNHFYYALKAFKDDRYITVDGKPMFVIFNPNDFKEIQLFIELWRTLAVENGLSGIHFVGITSNASFRNIGDYKSGKVRLPDLHDGQKRYKHTLNQGFDAVCADGKTRAQFLTTGIRRAVLKAIAKRYFKIQRPQVYDHRLINEFMYIEADRWENVYPCVLPNWDRSPRDKTAEVFINSTPAVFKENLLRVLDLVKDKSFDHKIIFLKSWNEWGEGNYVEPDALYQKGYLDVLKETLFN